MARNSLGREVPETWNGRRYAPYRDPFSRMPTMDRATRPLVRRNPGESKILPTLRAAIEKSGLRDGMTIATHHHLRNGDFLLNHVVRCIENMGLRDIRVASSSVHHPWCDRSTSRTRSRSSGPPRWPRLAPSSSAPRLAR